MIEHDEHDDTMTSIGRLRQPTEEVTAQGRPRRGD
jgi:hypothetical protein